MEIDTYEEGDEERLNGESDRESWRDMDEEREIERENIFVVVAFKKWNTRKAYKDGRNYTIAH
ncbi:hypothetical protein TSUD_54220 [Trifolium subterraneum]|uniref:Uncharacterized protein n=1 Tax=Trifolium subterraneum TaxID=3900 RepID=A0A2Z6MHV9_TRISU|nr:hypothetical protein TSUD_54220 [Trifolium subterraneum]